LGTAPAATMNLCENRDVDQSFRLPVCGAGFAH
jgi:hypothetical protein